MAHLGKDSYSHIHYDSEQARTISVREAARLQSFPDGFMFCGTMNPAFRQIGNAVPPLMAKALAGNDRTRTLEGRREESGMMPVRTRSSSLRRPSLRADSARAPQHEVSPHVRGFEQSHKVIWRRHSSSASPTSDIRGGSRRASSFACVLTFFRRRMRSISQSGALPTRQPVIAGWRDEASRQRPKTQCRGLNGRRRRTARGQR